MNLNLMGYLIGFLQELSKYVEESDDYGIIFGESICDNIPQDLYKDCVEYMMRNWDTLLLFRIN